MLHVLCRGVWQQYKEGAWGRGIKRRAGTEVGRCVVREGTGIISGKECGKGSHASLFERSVAIEREMVW